MSISNLFVDNEYNLKCKDLTLFGNLYMSGDISLDEMRVNNSLNSTSTTTGALIVSGGIGIGGNLNIGGVINGNHLTQSGQYWEDWQLVGMVRPTGTNKPSLEEFNNTTILMYNFKPAGSESVCCQGQLPHSSSGIILPHIHVISNDNLAGNTIWELKIILWKAGSGGYITLLDEIITINMPQVAFNIIVGAFSQLDLSNIGGVDYRPSGIMAMRLTRLGGDVGDTYPSICWLGGFDLHYTISQIGGSVSTYP